MTGSDHANGPSMVTKRDCRYGPSKNEAVTCGNGVRNMVAIHVTEHTVKTGSHTTFRARWLHLPGLHGSLHDDLEPGIRNRADAGVQRRERRPDACRRGGPRGIARLHHHLWHPDAIVPPVGCLNVLFSHVTKKATIDLVQPTRQRRASRGDETGPKRRLPSCARKRGQGPECHGGFSHEATVALPSWVAYDHADAVCSQRYMLWLLGMAMASGRVTTANQGGAT
jgi:hypothetical protein